MRSININKLRQCGEDDTIKVIKLKYYEPILSGIGCDIEDEKSKIKFVQRIEKIIRTSPEYKELIKFLKDYMEMKYCSFFNKVNKDIKGVSIEIHHTPFTLFDLVYIMINKYIENGYELNPFYLANDVMKMHYEGKVGLYPVSDTVHELVHDGEIYIPIKFVAANLLEFYEEYKNYMEEDQKLILAKHIELSDMAENVPDILKKKFIYLDIEDESVDNSLSLPNI